MKRRFGAVGYALSLTVLTLTERALAADTENASIAAPSGPSPQPAGIEMTASAGRATSPSAAGALTPIELSRLRPRLPYREGEPVPSHYVLKKSQRLGVIVPGALIVGVPWVLSAATGAVLREGLLAIPVLGPWLVLAETPDCVSPSCNEIGDELNGVTKGILILDGSLQTAGLLVLSAGLATAKTELIREDLAQVLVLPGRVGATGYGVSVFGRF